MFLSDKKNNNQKKKKMAEPNVADATEIAHDVDLPITKKAMAKRQKRLWMDEKQLDFGVSSVDYAERIDCPVPRAVSWKATFALTPAACASIMGSRVLKRKTYYMARSRPYLLQAADIQAEGPWGPYRCEVCRRRFRLPSFVVRTCTTGASLHRAVDNRLDPVQIHVSCAFHFVDGGQGQVAEDPWAPGWRQVRSNESDIMRQMWWGETAVEEEEAEAEAEAAAPESPRGDQESMEEEMKGEKMKVEEAEELLEESGVWEDLTGFICSTA